MKEDSSSLRQVFNFTLGIILCYMLARSGILHIANSHGLSWKQYDLWMTLPRLLGFGISFVIITQQGGLRRWGWHAELSRRGLLLLALVIAADIAYHASGTPQLKFSTAELLLGLSTTVAVVLFEESCFRGLVYFTLRNRYGAVGSAVLSSVMFTLFHWEVQPISVWPHIFVFGMIACLALELGTGLVWVAIAHEIVDVLNYLGIWHGIGHPVFEAASYLIDATALVLALCWMVPKSKCSHETGVSNVSLSIRETLATLGLITSWIVGYISLRLSLLAFIDPKAPPGAAIMFLIIAIPLLPPARNYVYSVLCRIIGRKLPPV